MDRLQPIEASELLKDTKTQAIINNDSRAYKSALARKALRKERADLIKRVSDLEERLASLEAYFIESI